MNPDFSDRIAQLKEFQTLVGIVGNQLQLLASDDISAYGDQFLMDRIVMAEQLLNHAKLKLNQ